MDEEGKSQPKEEPGSDERVSAFHQGGGHFFYHSFDQERPFTVDATVSGKAARLQALDVEALPPSYSSNTAKENLCLEYVQNFRSQFVQLFPQRQELLLCPRNECSVRKFVCTTLRPTQLPYRSLYDAKQCAEFVANFFQYEPLPNPTALPEVLPSPATVIDWCVGDCFDLAGVLVSYLLGVGYDAYMVNGYAPKWVCLRDQTRQPCPLLDDAAGEESGPGSGAASASSANPGSAEAKAEAKAAQDAAAAAKEEAAAAAKEAAAAAAEGKGGEGKGEGGGEEDPAADAKDALADALANGPVLVRNGGEDDTAAAKYVVRDRGAPSSKFVAEMKQRQLDEEARKEHEADSEDDEDSDDEEDPLEGERVHCWVLVRAGKRDVQDHFFIEPSTGRVYPVSAAPYLGVETIWNSNNYWVNMQTDRAVGEMSLDVTNPDFWEYVFLSPSRRPEPDEEQAPEFGQIGDDLAGGENDDGEQADEDDDDDNILDMPPSWVRKLVFDRDAVGLRYWPDGQRTILYRRAKLELFAANTHEQGMVSRLTVFRDRARTVPKEIREIFQNRRDKLLRRTRCPLDGVVREFFLPGRVPEALKERIEVTGQRRELWFYTNARIDGLVKREEVIGRKSIETFCDRDDHLVYRSVSVSHNRDGLSKSTFSLPGGQLGELVITKMTEKFERDEAVAQGQDIAKRTYYVREGRVRVQYHYASGRITAASRVFHKAVNVPVDVVQVDPFAPRPKQSVLDEEFQAILQAEKDAYTAVRHSELETQELLKFRKREESLIHLDRSIFETAREKKKTEDKQEKEVEEETAVDVRRVDYLTPFLQNVADPRNVTREEAQRARDQCLRALKERLVERAKIIQQRLDEENAALGKRQAAFQRSQRDQDLSASAEYEKYCSAAMFRLQILDSRLARHEETAMNKYVDLDRRLMADPRLAVLQS